jgi:hypothetical protein
MIGSNEDRDRSRRLGVKDRDDQTQVRYSVAGWSRDWGDAVCDMHRAQGGESANFLV